MLIAPNARHERAFIFLSVVNVTRHTSNVLFKLL